MKGEGLNINFLELIHKGLCLLFKGYGQGFGSGPGVFARIRIRFSNFSEYGSGFSPRSAKK